MAFLFSIVAWVVVRTWGFGILEARVDKTSLGNCLYLSVASVGWLSWASRDKPDFTGAVSLPDLGIPVEELRSCFKRAF